MNVEKGHELPDENRGRKAVYPFDQCTEVGDSFFIPGKNHQDVSSTVSYWNNKPDGKKFKPSVYDKDKNRQIKDGVEGIRIFRVA